MKLRQLRNSMREFMTHDQSNIGVLRQIMWYYGTYRPLNRKGELSAYLLEIPFETLRDRYIEQDAMLLGFGILARRYFFGEKRWVVTGGVIPSVRGFGFGKALFRFLSSINGEVWLDVLDTNEPAISLYKSIGYKEVDHTDGIITMKLARE